MIPTKKMGAHAPVVLLLIKIRWIYLLLSVFMEMTETMIWCLLVISMLNCYLPEYWISCGARGTHIW